MDQVQKNGRTEKVCMEVYRIQQKTCRLRDSVILCADSIQKLNQEFTFLLKILSDFCFIMKSFTRVLLPLRNFARSSDRILLPYEELNQKFLQSFALPPRPLLFYQDILQRSFISSFSILFYIIFYVALFCCCSYDQT